MYVKLSGIKENLKLYIKDLKKFILGVNKVYYCCQ